MFVTVNNYRTKRSNKNADFVCIIKKYTENMNYNLGFCNRLWMLTYRLPRY